MWTLDSILQEGTVLLVPVPQASLLLRERLVADRRLSGILEELGRLQGALRGRDRQLRGQLTSQQEVRGGAELKN